MTTWVDVHTAFRALLTDEWVETPIAWQNEDFVEVYGTAWVYAEMLPIDTDMTNFNSPGQRIKSGSGLFALSLMVPTGTGIADGLELAEALSIVLNLRNLGDGIETGPAEIGGAGTADDEGNWFRFSVTAPVFINATV